MFNVSFTFLNASRSNWFHAGLMVFSLCFGSALNAQEVPKTSVPKSSAAKSSGPCRYGDAAQYLAPFRSTKTLNHVNIEARALLVRGVVPGVGPFTTRLYACSHTGADVVLVLDMAETEMDVIRNARKGLNILVPLLMGQSSARAFELELASMTNGDLMVEPDNKALAAAAGYSELDLQIENRNGFTIVLFKFYSGE